MLGHIRHLQAIPQGKLGMRERWACNGRHNLLLLLPRQMAALSMQSGAALLAATPA